MTTIYLIRHGQASFGKDNYDELSELGVVQAARLGAVLSQRLTQFDAVALGSMWRHEQTASGCLAEFGLGYQDCDPQVDAGWNEYDHQEILRVYRPEFKNAATMMAFVREQKNPKAFFEQEFNAAINRWIGGHHNADYSETWGEFQRRVQGALERVIADNASASSIAVFTSGGPISLVSQSLLGVPAEHIMRMNWTLMNCGVTKVVTTRSRKFIASLNEHTHFEGKEYKHLITYT